MIRLGARLALAGGRGSVAAVGLTALAVAFGTAILLFALSFEPAFRTRYANAAWRDTRADDGVEALTATHGLLLSRTDDRVLGRELVRLDVAALSPDAPVPPGLPALPGPGEAFVSPALAELIARMPAPELGDRFGTVVGTIGGAGLRAPDELAAVVGLTPDALRVAGARPVTRLDTEPGSPPISPLLRLLVLIVVVGALAPVAVFVATATRLSAARRDQRLALLRLVGATHGQVSRMAAGEALAATIPGALGGLVLFWLLRPVAALVQLDGVGWFPDAMTPAPTVALGLLLAVQVVGVGAAIIALRRVAVSPLGVTRRQAARPLRLARLLPAAACVVVLAAGLVLARRPTDGDLGLGLTLGGFFGIIVGIAIAGPWLTMVVGRALARLARGVASLLAARRLTDDPRAAFGAIAGVVMAVFVASVYFSVAAYARAARDQAPGIALAPGTVAATVPAGVGIRADALGDRLRAVTGVAGVAVLREGLLARGDDVQLWAAIVDCADLRSAVPFDGPCGQRPLLAYPGVEVPPGAGYVFRGSPATEPASPGGRVDSLEAPLPPVDGAGTLTPRDERGPAFAVLLSPALLPDRGARFAPTQLLVATDGRPVTQEQVRTLIEATLPTATVRTDADLAAEATVQLDELGRIVVLGLFGTMLMAGCSLAVATAGGLIERRWPFALLRLAGMPLGRLRAMLVIEAAAPLAVAAVVSAAMGLAVGQLVLRLSASGVAEVGGIVAPDATSLAIMALAVAAALGVVGLALPLLGRVTDTESTRFE